MTRSEIIRLFRVLFVLTGLAMILPACTTTGSTSDHVNAKLREHGV